MIKKNEALLCSGGESRWCVVVGKAPSDSEKFAVDELIDHFEQMSGVRLRRKADASPISDYEICIGAGRHATLAESAGKLEGFDSEEFTVCIEKKRIVIVGHPERGTLYGVYEFLEEELGIRWYTPEITHIPVLSPTTALIILLNPPNGMTRPQSSI